MKSILILHQYFLKPTEDGSHRIFSHANNLSKSGYKVTVITSQRSNEQKELWSKEIINENLIVFRLRNNGYFHGSSKSSTLERIKSFLFFSFHSTIKSFFMKKDLVYATSTPLTISIPAIFLKLVLWKKFIFEVRDMWPDVPIKMGFLKNKILIALAYLLEFIAYKLASKIIVLSPGMKDEIINKHINENKIVTIENGCDNFAEYYDKSNIFSLPSEIQDKKIILYAGSLSPLYEIDFIVDLSKSILERTNDIVVVVAGRGVKSDEMVQKAKDLEVFNKSFFYLGAISKIQVQKLFEYSSISLNLGAGHHEAEKFALNNKFFDSISSGTPICTNFHSYQTDIALKNNFGFLINHKQLNESTQSIIKHINDDDWLDKASKSAINLATTKYNRKEQTKKIIKLIDGI